MLQSKLKVVPQKEISFSLLISGFSVCDEWKFSWDLSSVFNLTNTKQIVRVVFPQSRANIWYLLTALEDSGRISEAFSQAKILTGKILSGKCNIKNRDKQSEKIEENSTIQSHDWLGPISKSWFAFYLQVSNDVNVELYIKKEVWAVCMSCFFWQTEL